ncbi:MAG: hypothetical protein JXR77_17025 [Lentisphaeria bacterium]|nr:hypothetical protein [Lentisphaeria bacterium]
MWLTALGTWLGAFLFLAFVVDMRVFYEAGLWFPPFQLDPRFCLPVLRFPGGAVELADGFLAQLDHYGWVSAAVLATIVTFLALGLGHIASRMLGRGGPLWACLAATLALISLGRHVRHGTALLGLTLAVGLALLHTARRPSSRAGRLAQLLVLGTALYYLAGGPAAAFFLLCAAGEFVAPRDEVTGAATLLCGVAIPIAVGVLACGLPFADAFGRLLPMYSPGQYEGLLALSALYAVVAVLCAVAVLRAAQGGDPRALEPGSWRHRLTVLWGRHPRAARLLPPLAAAAVVLACVDWQRGLELDLRRAARRGDWQATLAFASRLRGREPALATSYCIDRALLHTGELLETMFRFPQAPLALTLGMALDVRTIPEIFELRRMLYFDIGDATLEIGLLNEAEHEAFEMLTCAGPHPTILLRLARIYTVKGNLPAARHAIEALTRDIVHRSRAREWLRQLDRDPAAMVTPGVLAMRKRRPVDDAYHVGLDVPRRCEVLLAADPTNRLAVDTLIGQCLLERDLEAVARNLERLRTAGYTRLPRHVQEALIVYEAVGHAPAPASGWTPDPEPAAAYREFSAALQPYYASGDTQGARKALAPRFGHTFYYYYACGRSPGMSER